MSALGHGTGTVRGRPTASPSMTDVTRILLDIERGDTKAAEHLLPLVYDELRKLARERPGLTLQATALVHEAYLRLVGGSPAPAWDSRGHFFAAAAEAMRRILVDEARRKASLKRGGHLRRRMLEEAEVGVDEHADDLLALDGALSRLADVDPMAARLVQLRYFAGLTTEQAAEALGISARTAYYTWAYARSWLRRAIRGE
jgi:RNA polymerase sigma factor (TIGR02999 family)